MPCARTSESLRSRAWGATIESEKLWETILQTMQQQEFKQAIKREWERDASLREEFAEDFATWSAFKHAEKANRFVIFGKENRQVG
jgi:hypothetical protein